LPDGALEHLAQMIERSIYNAAIDKSKEKNTPTCWNSEAFVEQYSSIGYTVKINLDVHSSVNKNKDSIIGEYVAQRLYNYMIWQYACVVCRKVLGLTICPKVQNYLPHFDPRKLGYCNSQELNPLINRDYVETIILRTQQETKVKTSSMYKCICGEKKTVSYHLQTRSLDEGGTLFIRCLSCQRVWSLRN
jgi:DNA-directed RNA polymerase subunit M/transcription elongation factor TFIIS